MAKWVLIFSRSLAWFSRKAVNLYGCDQLADVPAFSRLKNLILH